MTDTTTQPSETPTDPVERVLARAEARSGVRVFGSDATVPDGRVTGAAQALQDESTAGGAGADGEQWDREERAALRRVPGLSTELEDVTEVE